MKCFNCGDTVVEPVSGLLIKGAFYCTKCSISDEQLCVDETPDLVKGYLKGQAASLRLLEERHGLVEIGKAIDNFKSGRREGTVFGVEEENRRCVDIIKNKLHNDSFGVCNCSDCAARIKVISEITLDIYEKAI